MSYADKLDLSFEPEKRILHIRCIEEVGINTKEELDIIYKDLLDAFRTCVGSGQCYLIININKLKISSSVAKEFITYMDEFYRSCVYDDGYVGYGNQIFRLTRLIAYKMYGGPKPNMKRDEYEARKYIDSLIIQQRKEQINS